MQSIQNDSVIRQLRVRGESALADLFERERSRLGKMVSNRLPGEFGRRIDPSDVLQESFLAAVSSLSEYLEAPRLPPFLWLRGLTQRVILAQARFHRAAKRDPRLEREGRTKSGPILVELIADSMASPASKLSREESLEVVRAEIRELPDVDRQILDLHYAEQMTLLEVSQEIDVKYETVKKRHIRALKALHKKAGFYEGERE